MDPQELLRRHRETPDDQDLLERTVEALVRHNIPVPASVYDLRARDGRRVDARVEMDLFVEVHGEVLRVGSTPSRARGFELPNHRFAWARPRSIRKLVGALADAERAGLRGLSLARLNACDGDLELIANYDHLEYLDLSSNRELSDEGLADLEDATELAALSLRGCTGIAGFGLEFLGALPALVRLDIGGNPGLEDRHLEHLRALPRLTELILSGSPRVRGHALSALPVLTRIDASSTGLDRQGTIALGGLKHLEELDLSSTRLDDQALTAIGAPERLHTLDVSRSAVTGAGIHFALSLPSLRTLAMRNLKGRLDDACPEQSAVRHLDASQSRWSDDDMASLARYPLRTLRLDGSTISDVGVSALRRANGLESLSLGGQSKASKRRLAMAPDRVAQAVEGLSRLRELRVRGTESLTVVGAKALASLGSLARLELPESMTESPAAVFRALEPCQKLVHLDLSGANSGDRVVSLATTLPLLAELVAFDVRFSRADLVGLAGTQLRTLRVGQVDHAAADALRDLSIRHLELATLGELNDGALRWLPPRLETFTIPKRVKGVTQKQVRNVAPRCLLVRS